MKIIRIVGDQISRLVGIRCDRCGDVARLYGDISGKFALQEYLAVEFVSGYGTKVFLDGNRYSCELCESCVKNLLGEYLRSAETWLTKPEVELHSGGNPELDK